LGGGHGVVARSSEQDGSVANGAGPMRSAGDIAKQLAAAERVAVRPVPSRPGLLRRLLEMIRPTT